MSYGWKYKLWLFFLYVCVYTFCYIIPNLFPFSEPQYLSMIWLDDVFSLVPWSFAVYLSDYVLAASVILFHLKKENFDSFVRMAFPVLMICGVFFIFYPTTYPRPEYPEVSNPVVSFLMNLVRSADTPNNCFPSMHVATTTIAVWSTRVWGSKWFSTYILWALAICVSTLTTKQHYFWDIIGGIGVGAFVAWLEVAYFSRTSFGRWVSRACFNYQ